MYEFFLGTMAAWFVIGLIILLGSYYNLFESDAFIILIALPAVIPIVIFSVIGRFFVLIRRWIKQNMKELRENRKDGKSRQTK